MTEPDVDVATWFEDILARSASGRDIRTLPYAEQVVYYIVAVRTEADMNRFCSVFEQLLTDEADVAFFERALHHLGEDELATEFSAIRRLLNASGYFLDPTREFHSLTESVRESFALLEQHVLSRDRLWELDEKLARLRIQA